MSKSTPWSTWTAPKLFSIPRRLSSGVPVAGTGRSVSVAVMWSGPPDQGRVSGRGHAGSGPRRTAWTGPGPAAGATSYWVGVVLGWNGEEAPTRVPTRRPAPSRMASADAGLLAGLGELSGADVRRLGETVVEDLLDVVLEDRL